MEGKLNVTSIYPPPRGGAGGGHISALNSSPLVPLQEGDII